MTVTEFISPQAWSAIAATFSALAAWQAYSLQKRARQAQDSPNLLLSGLQATQTGTMWQLRVGGVRNLGPGIARNVVLVLVVHTRWAREHIGGGTMLHMLGPGEAGNLEGQGTVAAPRLGQGRFAHRFVTATVVAWDLAGRRHRFVHEVLVTPIAATEVAVPLDASIGTVSHTSRSVKGLKAQRWLMGLLGRTPRELMW